MGEASTHLDDLYQTIQFLRTLSIWTTPSAKGSDVNITHLHTNKDINEHRNVGDFLKAGKMLALNWKLDSIQITSVIAYWQFVAYDLRVVLKLK